MEALILVTPEQLKAYISDTIRDEFSKLAPSKSTNEQEATTESYLTRQEVASILKISLPTLNELTKSGLLPSFRIASNIRYKASDINLALINNTPNVKKVKLSKR